MALKIQSASMLTCERVLQEQDGILSAIRLVDIFVIPDLTPVGFIIAFWIIVNLKLEVGSNPPADVPVEFTIIRSTGERAVMGAQKTSTVQRVTIPGAPIGVGLIMQVGLEPRNMGTAYIEANIGDGELVIKTPITILRSSDVPKHQ